MGSLKRMFARAVAPLTESTSRLFARKAPLMPPESASPKSTLMAREDAQQLQITEEGLKKDTTLEAIVLNAIQGSPKPTLDLDTALISSGLIDSFALAGLVLDLEEAYGIEVPDQYRRATYFETMNAIQSLVDLCRDSDHVASEPTEHSLLTERQTSREMLRQGVASQKDQSSLIEALINHNPFGGLLNGFLLRLAGARVGRDVLFHGRVRLKLRGRAENISIQDGVILGRDVDLRNRENGKITLRPYVKLDDGVRIVAARDGSVDIGYGTRIGAGTVINSGGTVQIGEFCLIAGNVNINSSTHGTAPSQFIAQQPQRHGKIEIEDDVWLGAGASVLTDTHIHEGAVIGANSVVKGEVPALAVCAGAPAKVLYYR